MSRKWLEKEAPQWVERGIVTQEQAGRILDLYKDRSQPSRLLPILGSILVGLGILSFIAANWQELPELLRLLMMMVFTGGFYAAAEVLQRRGQEKFATAFAGLGVMTFGAGIILIGQMFHLIAYSAGSFILWAAAGAAAAYLYRSRYLALLALLLFDIAQWYSVSEFNGFSYTAFLVMAAVMYVPVMRWKSALLTWCGALSWTVHSLMWAVSEDLSFLWMFVPAMALYAAGDWLREREGGYALQTAPLAAAYGFAVFMVLFPPEWDSGMLSELRAEPLYYVPALLLVFAVSLAGKFRQGRASSAFEWILLAPYVYLPSGYEVLYLLALFFFSFYVLWRGYAEEFRFKINFGTVLFICSTLVAYGKLTWAFMDKSLFFILGGVLLLVLSWFLNRRKNRFLSEVKGDDGHGK
ncbi:hypothetical protein PM3016_5967 [Paenibacillus mucilaginosus 3016]|uniref:DUF2157 domain-containing protein n=1 Tax=Paenibacillus mucilaginosus 3016 TaxID=1116391 RepID=H6NPL2_9BACL|nr:DUF2157 domain-containing protein [Paenibacillus mucilaginosus]AFC32624.1 hypothetical protein PM3016_5967 [Paenibacillus mucilaginosus 3016]WFA21096.1 DUF2157 domain-containing protein [Paenibacillus mucilaginosus]